MTADYKVYLQDGSVFLISGVASFHYFNAQGKVVEDGVEEGSLLMQFNDSDGEKIGHLVHSNVRSVTLAP